MLAIPYEDFDSSTFRFFLHILVFEYYEFHIRLRYMFKRLNLAVVNLSWTLIATLWHLLIMLLAVLHF